MKSTTITILHLMSALLIVPTAASAESVIQDIEKTKILKVCQASDAPWSSINPMSGEWEGLTVDMVKELGAALEVEVQITDSGWSALVQNLSTGKCHISAAPMFATVPRGKVVIFTRPFAHEGQLAVVKSDSAISKFSDLDQPGKVILAEAGSATTVFAQQFFKNAEIKVVSTTDKLQQIADVAAGRADAVWFSYIANRLLLESNTNLGVKFLDEQPVGFSAIRWAVPAGEYQFQQLVDNWIEQSINSGAVAAYWDKWFAGVPYVQGSAK